MIDMQKIFQESLSEWLEQSPDDTKLKTPSGETIPRELLAHSEICVKDFLGGLLCLISENV